MHAVAVPTPTARHCSKWLRPAPRRAASRGGARATTKKGHCPAEWLGDLERSVSLALSGCPVRVQRGRQPAGCSAVQRPEQHRRMHLAVPVCASPPAFETGQRRGAPGGTGGWRCSLLRCCAARPGRPMSPPPQGQGQRGAPVRPAPRPQGRARVLPPKFKFHRRLNATPETGNRTWHLQAAAPARLAQAACRGHLELGRGSAARRETAPRSAGRPGRPQTVPEVTGGAGGAGGVARGSGRPAILK